MSKLRVFVVGLGNMGLSHAQAYHSNPGFEIVGLANRSEVKLPAALQSYPRFGTFEEGLAKTKPDLVSINTLTDFARRLCASRRWKPARTSSSRSRWRRPWRMPSAWSRPPRG